MHRPTLWRAAALQAASVAALSVLLAAATPEDFFEDWGWLAGPAAWIACAALTSKVLSLPLGQALIGAAVAGVVSGVFVVAGVHWLGAAAAVVVFALWCARLRDAPSLPARTI